MFCESCGAKLEKGSKFCESCGAKITENSSLESKQEEISPKEKKEKKPFKVTLPMIIIAIIVILGGAFWVVSMQFSPEKTAEKYLGCLKDNSACFANHLDIKEDEFFNIGEIEKYMKENKTDNGISRFEILGSRKLGKTGYKIKVKVYPVDKDEEAIETELDIIQVDGKNLGIFPKYIVDANTGVVVEDFQIIVPENASVKLNDIEVKKYGKTTDGITTYTIPYLIDKKHKVTVNYAGLEVSEETDYGYKFGGEVEINDELKNNFADKSKTIINNIYKNIVDGKEFNKSGVAASYKEIYEDIQKAVMKDYSTLTAFDITKMTFKSSTITSDYQLKVSYTINYDYEIKYFDSKYTNSTSRVVTLLIKLDNDKTIIDIDNLPTYFSTYSY